MNNLTVQTTEFHIMVSVPNGAAYTFTRKMVEWNRDKQNPQMYLDAAVFLSGEGQIDVVPDNIKELCEGAL